MLLLTDFFIRHLHLLRHVRRSRHALNTQQMKSLVRTSQAVQLTTHRPKRCLNPVVCDNVVARADAGLLFHYRSKCVKDISKDDCEALTSEVVEDKNLWRNGRRREVAEATEATLRKLQII